MKLRLLILCISIIGLGLTIGFNKKENPHRVVLIKEILSTTTSNHIDPQEINDDLSKRMFDSYLTLLDPNKIVFTQKDIDQLNEFQLHIDDELKNGEFNFFDHTNFLYKQGITKTEKYYQAAIEKGIDLSQNEWFETDSSKLDYPQNDEALAKRWHKKLTKFVFDELIIEEANEPNIDVNQQKNNSIERVQTMVDSYFERRKNMNENDFIERYINAYLKLHDFQSTYMSPVKKASWDAAFTRSYVGIGVHIKRKNGYPKISEVFIGGPAWKTKAIDDGDVILAIEAVSTFGLSIDEVINLLKGEKATKVVLKIEKLNGDIKEVTVIRDKVVNDLAMSFVLTEQQQKRKIGYLRLPRFYAGEEGAAYHVLQEINNLKANEVEGIIFDIRNNQGGSAREAIDIMGYFLKEGIVGQTEGRQWSDEDGVTQYDGELLIMTNARSGSASELCSGTLQDYKRACIVGSRATFGKGSRQRFFDMENEEDGETTQLGSVKLTVGRFFTASGRSPQFKGIRPDIILPDDYLYVPSGERVHKNTLPPEDLAINEVSQSVNVVSNLDDLKTRSKKRVDKDARLQLAKQKALSIKKKQDKSRISLDYKEYKAVKIHKEKEDKYFSKVFDAIEGFEVSLSSNKLDSITILKQEKFLDKIRKDPYVYECYWIMNDMLES